MAPQKKTKAADEELIKRTEGVAEFVLKGGIPRNSFLHDHAVTEAHVEALFGRHFLSHEVQKQLRDVESNDETLLECLVRKIHQIKMDASSFGRQKIQVLVVQYCKPRLARIGVIINTFTQLCNHWKTKPDLYTAALLFMAFVGEFDHKPRWAEEMEREFMLENGLTYDDTEIEKKSCIEQMMSQAKNNCVKRVNSPIDKNNWFGKNRVGKNRQPELTEKEQVKRRRKGESLGAFCAINGRLYYDAKKVIEEYEKENFPSGGKTLEERELMNGPLTSTPDSVRGQVSKRFVLFFNKF